MKWLIRSFMLALFAVAANGFFISSSLKTFSRSGQLISMSDKSTSGSPLPDFATPKIVSSGQTIERDLDNAMDFLEETGVEKASEDDEEEEDDFSSIYEDSLEFEIDEELVAEYIAKDMKRAQNPPKLMADVHRERRQEVIQKWKTHDKDVGSSAVQVAIIHERILYLTTHLLKNKHDNSAKRGLQQLVVARRKHLDYLFYHDRPTTQRLVTELGIRYRAPGRVWDKEQKYGRFKNTKQPKKVKKGAKKVKKAVNDL